MKCELPHALTGEDLEVKIADRFIVSANRWALLTVRKETAKSRSASEQLLAWDNVDTSRPAHTSAVCTVTAELSRLHRPGPRKWHIILSSANILKQPFAKCHSRWIGNTQVFTVEMVRYLFIFSEFPRYLDKNKTRNDEMSANPGPQNTFQAFFKTWFTYLGICTLQVKIIYRFP